MNNLIKKYTSIIKAITAFLLFFSSSYIQLLLVIILNINLDNITTTQATIISSISSLIITILLILLYRKELISEFKTFKKNISENLDIGFKYWMIGLLLMVVSNLIINFIFNAGQANNEEAVQKMISAVPYLVLISAGILAPITEEIVFRKTFKDIINNKIFYVIISGLVFGYLHVASADTIQQFLYIIPYSSLGICFAISYSKTDTIYTSMSMHMLHNIILTIFSIIK